ncbi:GrpB family protein [Paenibacillus piri]|uniref:GrpB family protein n=1 Tax=Paenibacillus piri TaxID=2547395 RepID=A0A4R5KKI7_9BACL|nr:GrpB family protein [Paenibacillus piri]TDF95027.1 GrpB family protein [Paenibacillus piri]
MAERTRVIEVVPYDAEWKIQFERIKEMIVGYIGDLVLAVEHVGSTSVEGLSAKPIIDLDVVMDSYDVLPTIIERLEQAGFEHQGNLGIEGREAFRRTYDDGFMKYHLYVCPKDGKGYLEHIAFRDYLRANEEAKKEYEALKQRLAEAYRYDIDSYVDRKTAFVRDILNKTIYKTDDSKKARESG